MKKLLTVFLVVVSAVCTAFSFTACDLFGNTSSGDGTTATTPNEGTESNSGTDNNSSTGNNSGTGNNSAGSSSGNNSSTGSNSGSGSNSGTANSSGTGGNSSAGTAHTCLYTFTSTVSPDCTNQGYDLYTCSCGKTDKRNYTKALGHNYKQTISLGTCTTDWSMTEVCSTCGDIKVTTVPNTKRHSYGAYISNNDATCMADGTETATCTGCGKTDTRTVTGSKTGHSYGAYVSNNDATCTADGTETATCAGCGKTDTRTVSGSKLGHSYVNGACTVCGAASATNGLLFTDYANYSEVTGLGTESGAIVVPDTHNGKPVMGISWAFNYCPDVTSLVITANVKDLQPDACFGCKNLKSVTCKGVESIGYNAFGSCTSLTTVNISASVTFIGEFAFADCTSLSVINFDGTKAQWNAINKEPDWDYKTGNYKIVCTDGII